MTADRVTTFKIFIGNIKEGTQSEDVRKIFEEFGTVVECDCVGKKAFVHMEDDIEGKHAIDQLQGRELNGKVLTIQESNNTKFELPMLPTVKLLVKNVSSSIDARGIRNLFKRFGFIVEVMLENGEGFVRIEATGDIGSAIKEMNGYVVDDQAISVEPAPVDSSPSKPKYQKKKWADAYKFDDQDYAQDAEGGGWEGGGYEEDYNNYDYNPEPSPWEFNRPAMRPSFRPPPERILRDPRGSNNSRRFQSSAFHGPPQPLMGGRGMPPNMFPSGRGAMMGFEMPTRGRGGPSMRVPRNQDLTFQPQPNPFLGAMQHQMQQREEVFYEDEPIVAIPRSRPKLSLSGANSIPVGSTRGGNFDMLPRNPRGGGMNMKRGNRGRGKPLKFTAVTHEVSPGEKYPVPPMNNPSFRAPLKWPKEEVRRKGKKKKKELVPAELPDYSIPVPELPNPAVPRGAILKPFPPPATSNFMQYENNQSNNSQIDFTSDDY